MKKILNSICILVLLTIVSCTEKEACAYVTSETNPPSGCVENEFAGYMVFTQGSGFSNADDFGLIFNAKNTLNAPFGENWHDPILGVNQLTSIHPAMWKKSVIGNCFGIALDNSGGIYLSATNIYFGLGFGAGDDAVGVYGGGGSAGIYYTNMSNPNLTSTLVKTLNSASANTVGTSTIPSVTGGNSYLGNIAYDKANNQLFTTNGEDGRIYRINPTTGIVKSIFDPFVLDNGAVGRVSFGEQIWGIRTLLENGSTYVYFARSVSYSGSVGVKEIWSIKLDSNGEFMATEIGSSKLFDDSASSSVLQVANVRGSRPFIMDIAFSSTGQRMMVAERGNPHNSQAFEYIRSGATWIAGNNFYSGGSATGNDGQNCAGGVDYGNRQISTTNYKCDDIVWTTSNYMRPLLSISGLNGLYGIQGISALGNSATVINNNTTDLYIDFNTDTSTGDKGGIGDVEIFDFNCPCNN